MSNLKIVTLVSLFVMALPVQSLIADYASTVLEDNPIAYYRFEDSAGSDTLVDSSGNAVNGFEVNNVQFDVEGIVGRAGEFFGDGSIVLDLTFDPSEADFTIESWLYTTGVEEIEDPDTGDLIEVVADQQVYISQKDGIGLGRSDMLISSDRQLGSFIGGATTNAFDPFDHDPTPVETWLHFVMTYDSSNEEIYFYVDGEPSELNPQFPGNNGVESADGEWVIGSHKNQGTQFFSGTLDEIAFYDIRLSDERIKTHYEAAIDPDNGSPALQAGDADEDFDFDQIDLVRVQVAAKYLTGAPATWGEGDWDGAPGGQPGSPPPGNGLFDQLDVIAALGAGKYLTGPYAAVNSGGAIGDAQTSVVYDAVSGQLSVDAPSGIELTSINIDSAAGVFTGEPAQNLGGSFDNDADSNIFKATFGSSFGSLSFGNAAQVGLTEEFLLRDLTVIGSLAGGGDLGDVDLIYVPEPSTAILALLGMVGVVASYWRFKPTARSRFVHRSTSWVGLRACLVPARG